MNEPKDNATGTPSACRCYPSIGSRVEVRDGSEAHGDRGYVFEVANGVCLIELDAGCVWPVAEYWEVVEVEMKIFCDGKDREVHEALRVITPEWVESGESCHQTVIDLAATCRELLVRLNACRMRLNRAHRKASHGCTDASCSECDG